MSIKIFTVKEVVILSNNQYVKNVSTKSIIYTDEFKRIFIEENKKGKFPRLIFENHGFDIETIGMDRVKAAGKRWRAIYIKEGLDGLRDARKGRSGRPRIKALSIEQKYDRLKAQINLLKAENELLKKIDFLERGLVNRK